MAAYDILRPAVSGGHTPNLVARLLNRLIAWNDTRVTHKALSALSDRELNDIGLTRADIDRIAS